MIKEFRLEALFDERALTVGPSHTATGHAGSTPASCPPSTVLPDLRPSGEKHLYRRPRSVPTVGRVKRLITPRGLDY